MTPTSVEVMRVQGQAEISTLCISIETDTTVGSVSSLVITIFTPWVHSPWLV